MSDENARIMVIFVTVMFWIILAFLGVKAAALYYSMMVLYMIIWMKTEKIMNIYKKITRNLA